MRLHLIQISYTKWVPIRVIYTLAMTEVEINVDLKMLKESLQE